MSDTDSFIDEVTEEVRRDRLFAMMKKYGWIAVLAVLLLVGGTAWREYSRAQHAAQAQAFGDALLAALDNDDAADRAEALSTIDAATPGAMAVRDLLEASELANAGDDEGAVQVLNETAENGDVAEIYREVANYKAVSRDAAEMSADERRMRLESLAIPGKPLRLLAEEQLALLAVEAGETQDALERLRRIVEDSEVTPGLRQRASQLIVALGGTLGGGE